MVSRRREEENEWLNSNELHKNHYAKKDACLVGLYGWRRRCLFVMVTILLFLAMFNLALALWIIKALEFSSNGLGTMKIVSGGLELRGEALVLDNLISSKVRSRKGRTLQIEGSKHVRLNARLPSGRLGSGLILGNNLLDVTASSLKVDDSHKKTLFSVDKEQVLIGSETLTITGEGGAIFQGSLQTPKVKADSGHELRLESPTRSLDIFGTLGVNIVSGAGDISVLALDDVKLHSQSGMVHLEAPNIYFPDLQTAHIIKHGAPVNTTHRSHHSYSKSPATIYQVCICQKGRLFLAPPNGECAADNDVCR